MRTRTRLLVAFAIASAVPAAAQDPRPARSFMERAPLTISVSVPTGRPSISAGDVLVQAAYGLVGGLAAATVVSLPLLAAAESGDLEDDGLGLVVIGAAYVGGTTYGIHFAGRRQGMRANPWATAGGVVAGLAVGGATVGEDEDGAAVAGPLVFILPPLGGTAGYALTRRAP